jgi:hypothetical protein
MFGSSFTRGVGLCGLALLALGSQGDAAQAGSDTREQPTVYAKSSAILFGQDAKTVR